MCNMLCAVFSSHYLPFFNANYKLSKLKMCSGCDVCLFSNVKVEVYQRMLIFAKRIKGKKGTVYIGSDILNCNGVYLRDRV